MNFNEREEVLFDAVKYGIERNEEKFMSTLIGVMGSVAEEPADIKEELVEAVVEKMDTFYKNTLADLKIKLFAAEYYYFRRDYEKAAAFANECINNAAVSDGGIIEFEALHLSCKILSDTGEFEAAEKQAREILTLIDKLDIMDYEKMRIKTDCALIFTRNHSEKAKDEYESLISEMVAAGFKDTDIYATAKMNLGWYLIRNGEEADCDEKLIKEGIGHLENADSIFFCNTDDFQQIIYCKEYVAYGYLLLGKDGREKSIMNTDMLVELVNAACYESDPTFIDALTKAEFIYDQYDCEEKAEKVRAEIDRLMD